MRRELRPFVPNYDDKISGFRFTPLRDLSELGLSNWFEMWAENRDLCEIVVTHLSTFRCDSLVAFAEGLFSKARAIGILTHPDSEPNEWLVLQDRGKSDDRVHLSDLLSERPCGYFFLQEPNSEDLELAASVDASDLDLIERFFLTFGGLRDTPPFVGGDTFHTIPWNELRQILAARVTYERDWLESREIHVRGNLDRLLLHDDGRVGYLPGELERRIKIYSSTFAGAILKWLDDPLRDWDSEVF